jgi:excisionase family DNA binding protein
MADRFSQNHDDRPILLSIDEARQKINCSRTKFYELLGSHAIEARKLGRRTVVPDESLRRFVASLPTL